MIKKKHLSNTTSQKSFDPLKCKKSLWEVLRNAVASRQKNSQLYNLVIFILVLKLLYDLKLISGYILIPEYRMLKN